jgi:UDP-glucose-4-epimerase GalE
VSLSGAGQRIVVTGGAGYIGSHTVLQLIEQGYDVVVLDDLSHGYRHNVEPGQLREIRLQDGAGVRQVLEEKPCVAVIHFAAFISVGESMKDPGMYFENNTAGSLSLFRAMVEAGVKKLVFSSTAAVYGMPKSVPIPEDFPYAPVNVYGASKVMVEQILGWFDQIHGLKSVCLRFFNASGADPKGRRGEEHQPESHLIPLLFRAVESGKPITLFGQDYPTPDGTCIRDYIHVSDLAQAHIFAVEHLLNGGASDKFNVGTGKGFSVKEVVESVERVTGQKVPFDFGPRRDGDPAELVADSSRLKQVLGWSPQFAELDAIVKTAWDFERSRKPA